MAQLVGTGKNPQYPAGHVVDTPQDGPTYESLLANGECELPEGNEAVNPAAMGDYEIAQAIIRGDDLSAQIDREALKRFYDKGLDAHAVVASHGGIGAPNPADGPAPATGKQQLPNESSGGVDRPETEISIEGENDEVTAAAAPPASLADADARYSEMDVAELKTELDAHGLKEEDIKGTGTDGALTREDVVEALAKADLAAADGEHASA